jgi:hypothetical protein
MSVGANEYGGGSRDHAEYRELPLARVVGVNQPHPVSPWRDVDAAGLTEVE